MQEPPRGRGRGPRRIARLAGSVAAAALLTNLAAAQAGPFLEQGGLVVAEIESAPAAGAWLAETQHGGYTGSSYYRWTGGNQFNSPGKGVLSFDVKIQSPGKYYLAVHNRHQHSNSSEENDAWVRIDGGAWVKSYSNKGASTVKQWNWHTVFEVGGKHLEPMWDLSAGTHRVEFSGRSNNFMMDRFHLATKGHPLATNKSAPQSPIASPTGPYCTSKQTAGGCLPRLSATGSMSLSTPKPFVVSASEVPNNRNGLFFYGFGSANAPFLGGRLCVAPPLTRTRVQHSYGSATGDDCSGTFALDFKELVDPRLTAGATTYVQAWFRDPASTFGQGLSNGFAFTWLQ